MQCLFNEIGNTILECNPDAKCAATKKLFKSLESYTLLHDSEIKEIVEPGRPKELMMVAPRELKKRGIQSQQGRTILMHAIAHIEFNAINLALDAAYQFRNQPLEYYQDWLSVAADEARHFQLIEEYLQSNGSHYAQYPVHNGLWEMAVKTRSDIVARMALVPRVLEARGLDVTPGMIKRLRHVGDTEAVGILETIYQDEIGHVAIGSKWFRYHCVRRELEPKLTFLNMIRTHLHGEIRGPFNEEARLMAGFDAAELAALNNYSN